jgi:hypothetical protein
MCCTILKATLQPPAGAQRVRHADEPRLLGGIPAPATRKTPLPAHPRHLQRRPTLCRHLDGRQLLRLGAPAIANVQCQRLSHFRVFLLRHRHRRVCRYCRRRVVRPLAATGCFPPAHARAQHGPTRRRRYPGDRRSPTDRPRFAHFQTRNPGLSGKNGRIWRKKPSNCATACYLACTPPCGKILLDGTPVLRHAAFADAMTQNFGNRNAIFYLASTCGQPGGAAESAAPGCICQRQLVLFLDRPARTGEMFVNVMPDQIPFFVREGAVLPTYPVRNTPAKNPWMN